MTTEAQPPPTSDHDSGDSTERILARLEAIESKVDRLSSLRRLEAAATQAQEVPHLAAMTGDIFDAWMKKRIEEGLDPQAALEDLCRGRTADGADAFFTATLVPEPENPYDRNAVRVDIDGFTVGYLARPEAKAFRAALRGIGLGTRATACEARVVGGWDRGEGDVGHFGVRLDFEWPLRKA